MALLGCRGPAPAALAAGGQNPGRPEPVRLWQDASIFQLITGLIESAHRRVLVEMYELGRSDIVRDLGATEARGLDVRVITDPTVSASRRSAAELDDLLVPERVYPVDDSRHQIDHVKLLIVDGTAVIGGMNWGAHSDRNHDYVLETRVLAEVARVTAIFEQDWALAAGDPQPLAPQAGEIGQTTPGSEIRSLLYAALAGAMHRVLAEIYTLTDSETVALMAWARQRGEDVRVIMDPNQPYNLRAFAMLSEAGVGVRWYPVPRGALLHAKIGLFDGLLLLGSANWTASGLGVNHELDVETTDPAAVNAYASRFEADWARSAA